MRSSLMVVALATTISSSLAAQRLEAPVDRPRLRDVVDTNDAHAYYDLGLSVFEKDPGQAAAAFYWAARLDPAWGEPLYARRAALILSQPDLLADVIEDTRRTFESPRMRRLDSLQFRALMLSPFLYRQLDRRMFATYFRNAIQQNSRMRGGMDEPPTSIDYAVEQYLKKAGHGMRAFLAYGDGDFPRALRFYANALYNARDKAAVRLARARIFAMQSQVDSAVVEFGFALDAMRKRDQKDLVIFYDSKALTEYSIAVLQEGAGDGAGARESYGRSLQEDLAFYPAHMRLGMLALGVRDTATAVSELALASDLAPNEAHIRYIHGFVLIGAQRYVEAVGELQKAVELEPYYALPYLWLGRVFEQLEKEPQALAAYQKFIDRASSTDAQRTFAIERRDELKDIVAVIPPSKP
jgi:tetratricopeptide (TPR) repeat protein